jgi:hypothetical protein
VNGAFPRLHHRYLSAGLIQMHTTGGYEALLSKSPETMMLKTFSFLCILWIVSFGQDELSRLLRERDALYESYEHYNEQNSTLFGKKSKKDLQNVITSLQDIIAKDSEIIRAIRQQTARVRVAGTRQQSSHVGQTRETMRLVDNLRDESEKLEAMVKLKTSELNTQRENYLLAESKITFLSIALGILTVTVVLLVAYIHRLKGLVQQ